MEYDGLNDKCNHREVQLLGSIRNYDATNVKFCYKKK